MVPLSPPVGNHPIYLALHDLYIYCVVIVLSIQKRAARDMTEDAHGRSSSVTATSTRSELSPVAAGLRKARSRVVIVENKEIIEELGSVSTYHDGDGSLPSPLSITTDDTNTISRLPAPPMSASTTSSSHGSPFNLFHSTVAKAVKLDSAVAALKSHATGRKELVHDRTILDQRLFYRTLRPPPPGDRSLVEGQVSPLSMTLGASQQPPHSIDDSSLDPSGVSDAARWASKFSQVQGRTYMDLATLLDRTGDVTFSLPSGLEPKSNWNDAPSPAGTVAPVDVPDVTSLLFIRAIRDFYRTGVRFTRRNGLSRRNWRGNNSLSESMVKSTLTVAAESSVAPTQNVSPTPSGPSALRTKIRAVESELQMMQQAKRHGSLTDPHVAPIFGGEDQGSISVSTKRNRVDSLTFSGRRRSALDLILQPQLTLSQQKRHANNHSQRANIADDSDGEESEEETTAEMIADRQLVDRFTGASLEAMTAVARRLLLQPATRLHSIRVLSMSGAGVGDDGCFIVLQAMRFGPLKGVQCLDLLYNQLTTRSAFYMGIFLLLRPPITLVESATNNALRAAFEEADVPLDTRQHALSLIAAKRASQRGGGAGGASNRQGPLFFMPLFDSWKSLMQEFYSKRKVLCGMSSQLERQPSKMTNLRNVVQATLSFGALKAPKSKQYQITDEPTTLRSPMLASSESNIFSSSTAAIVDEDKFFGGESDDSNDESNEKSSDNEEIEDHLHELQALFLPANPSSGSSAASIAAGAQSPRTTSVSLGPTSVAPPSNQRLSKQLKELQEREMCNAATELVSLRLGWNDLQDEGVRMLSEWLAVQTFLLELNVSHNDATDIGFSALRDALRSTTSLISLNTEGNSMEDSTAEVMRGALLYNRRLHTRSSEGGAGTAGTGAASS
jgi:hypothetical protein